MIDFPCFSHFRLHFYYLRKRSAKSLNFSDFRSNVSVVELTGQTVRDYVEGWLLIPSSMSAILLMGSVVVFESKVPGTFWVESWGPLCFGSGFCIGSWDCTRQPVRNSGTVRGRVGSCHHVAILGTGLGVY